MSFQWKFLRPFGPQLVPVKTLHPRICVQMSILIVNAFLTSRGPKFAPHTWEFSIVSLNSRRVTKTIKIRRFLLKFYGVL